MTISSDWQIELQGLTIGAGTDYPITGPVTGLGNPEPRTGDQERGNSPGDVAGLDVPSRRILTVPHGAGSVDGTTPTEAWGLYETLKGAWTGAAADVTFDLRLPGFGDVARRFYGRPRGLDDDLELLRCGWVAVLGTFVALDPYAYGPEVEVTLPAGDTTVTSPGTATSDRYTLVLDGSGTVTVANAAEDEPPLTISGVTGIVIVDGRTRSIVDGLGVHVQPAPGSGWPLLTPGANPITLTGATGELTYRPAYL